MRLTPKGFNYVLTSLSYLLFLFLIVYTLYVLKHISTYNPYQLFLHYGNIWGILIVCIIWQGVVIPVNKIYTVLLLRE